VLSAEEARLWNIVTANCLDFNAWTALIDETERNFEVRFVLVLANLNRSSYFLCAAC
jgi:hypothetical protein